MRKIGISILIICLFCFPFVYFSMYQDFSNHSMLGYLIMIIVTSLLAFLGNFFCNLLPLIIGNIVSAIISLYFINEMTGNERWGGYFKPLTSYQLFILISFLNMIPQILALKLANWYKIKARN